MFEKRKGDQLTISCTKQRARLSNSTGAHFPQC
jgi:hypothetical protein